MTTYPVSLAVRNGLRISEGAHGGRQVETGEKLRSELEQVRPHTTCWRLPARDVYRVRYNSRRPLMQERRARATSDAMVEQAKLAHAMAESVAEQMLEETKLQVPQPFPHASRALAYARPTGSYLHPTRVQGCRSADATLRTVWAAGGGDRRAESARHG